MKEIYHSPIVETDQLFDVEAGDMSILARCWGLTSQGYNCGGTVKSRSNNNSCI